MKLTLRIILIGAATLALVFGQAAATKKAGEAKAAVEKKAALLDINSASQAELEGLKGIGPAYATKIIAGRPYKGKDELVSKKIMPEGVYSKVKDLIIAKQK